MINKRIIPIITIHRVHVAFVGAQERFDFLRIVLRVDEYHRVLLENGLVAQRIRRPCTSTPLRHRIVCPRAIALIHLQL